MKKKLPIFISLLFSLNLFSQPTMKVFAFEQENLPGTKPAGVTDENGNPVQKAAVRKDYFIYLSFNKAFNIVPTHVFIRGEPFAIKTVSIKKAPVYYVNHDIPANPEKITLVPATKNKVMFLQVDALKSGDNKTASIKKLTDKNDVVIVYLWKNNKYFVSLKKIQKLEPVANE